MMIKLKQYQDRFIFSDAKFPVLVSSWGTGKTLCLITKGLNLSRKYNNNLGVIFRKEYRDLADSTIKDFEQYTGLSPDSQREIKLNNGSVIMFRHLEELNNLQNLNLGWFGIEQAEELDTDDEFYKLWGRLRRVGTNLQGFLVANTKGHNWLHKLFKAGKLAVKEGMSLEGNRKLACLVEATTYDNADNLPKEYIDSLEILKIQKPAVYNRFVLNSWDEADVSDYIIHRDWLEQCIGLRLPIQPARVLLSIDPARYGDDESVFYVIKTDSVADTVILSGKSVPHLAGEGTRLINKHAVKMAVCDDIGVGGGVTDNLKEMVDYDKCSVVGVNSASAPSTDESKQRYLNLRAEMWSSVAEKIERQEVVIPEDEELINQLSGVKYRFERGKLRIESKDDIKKRLGKSPDRADAYIQGMYHIPQCPLWNSGLLSHKQRVYEHRGRGY